MLSCVVQGQLTMRSSVICYLHFNQAQYCEFLVKTLCTNLSQVCTSFLRNAQSKTGTRACMHIRSQTQESRKKQELNDKEVAALASLLDQVSTAGPTDILSQYKSLLNVFMHVHA